MHRSTKDIGLWRIAVIVMALFIARTHFNLFNLCDSIHFIEDGKIKFSRLDADFHTIEADIFHSLNQRTKF